MEPLCLLPLLIHFEFALGYLFLLLHVPFFLLLSHCSPSLSALDFIRLSSSLAGATDNSYASAFLKQVGNVLEFGLDLPSLVARLAYAAGAAHRVAQIMEAINVFNEHSLAQVTTASNDVDYIELDNVSAAPPLAAFEITTTRATCCDRTQASTFPQYPNIVNKLSLRIRRGDSCVIMGPSGCGKSSLLRIIGGLWNINDGKITRPTKAGRGGLFFLPQKSYVFPGSLLANITYPDPPATVPASDNKARAEIEALLKLVRLDHVVDAYGLDSHCDWPTLLSGSERQQLSFARLFYHCPLFCLADEATCALPIDLEDELLTLCREKGITLISVAHRPSVVRHHQHMLTFDPATKSWSLAPIPTEQLHEHKQVQFGESSKHKTLVEPEEPTEGLGRVCCARLGRMLGTMFPSFASWGTLITILMFIFCGITGALQYVFFSFFFSCRFWGVVVVGCNRLFFLLPFFLSPLAAMSQLLLN